MFKLKIMIKLHKGKEVVYTNDKGREQIVYVSALETDYVELKSHDHACTFFLNLKKDGNKLSDVIREVKW